MLDAIKKHKTTVFLGILLLTLAGSYFWNQQQMVDIKTVSLPVNRTATAAVSPSATVSVTPLAAYQEKREQTRKADIASLETLALDKEASTQDRDQARAQLQEIIRCREAELAIEGALTGSGFAPCTAVVQQGAVTVLVEKAELTETEAAAILILATAHSGEAPECIRIVAGNAIK